MNCDSQFALRSVACTPDQRPILDFGEDQMDILLSEVGLIRGKATLNFEICSAHQNQNQNCLLVIRPRTIIHQDLCLGKLVPSPHKRSKLSN